MAKAETIYIISIPMAVGAEELMAMDFYRGFQSHFFKIYSLELKINPLTEDTCEMIFRGSEQATQAVIEVLKEMGLEPIYLTEDKYINNPTKYH